MLAELFVYCLIAYGALGVLFALAFVTTGVKRIDSQARNSGFGFRVLIFPGSAALWPILFRRWLGGAPDPAVEQNAHRRAAVVVSQ